MLNTYDHDDAELLTPNVERVVPRIHELLDRARDGGVEVIYVSDNYGSWNSSPGELAERACKGERPDLVEPILPPDDASFVIKARHTIFFETPLG
jgi:nicotinamidase-related amidase